MTTDTIKQLGAEFHHAADSLADTLARLDNARLERLAFLRHCSKDSTARLAALKEEVRTLPEQIAKWDAEAARLESQTAEDLLRQALEPAREAERAKCPACGKQPDRDALPLAPGEHVRCQSCQLILRVVDGAWQIVRPVENCGHVAEDGTCGHPNAQTPECHDGVVCPVKAAAPKMLDLRTVRDDSNHTDPDVIMADTDLFDAGETAATKAPLIRKGETFTVERKVSDHGKGPRVKVTREGQSQCYIGALQPAHVVPTPPAPTLLDLTKLPPGTACEALEDIPRWNGRTIAAGVRFTLRDQSIVEGDEFPMVVTTNGENSYCIPALVPARVVKEGVN